MSEITYMPFQELKEFMVEVLKHMKVPEKDADVIAEVLITADKRGIDSHGIGRFKPIYVDRLDEGTLNPLTKIDIIRDKGAIAVLDANNGFGHIAGKIAMEMAINKAKAFGLGMVTVKNSSHYGIAGYYTMMATAAGMIGITGTNARPSIAPTFGVENMLGTNPLTFGIPTDEDFDFILDCATSTSQRGMIEKYARNDKDLPKGWVIDNLGNSEIEPHKVLQDLIKGNAALTPLGGIGEELGGHKGYGYATVVEILSSALHAGPFLRDLTGLDSEGNKTPYRLGHFFIAIDVEHFIDLYSFKKQTGDILRDLRNSQKAPGQDRIYTAGEKEYLTYEERKGKGAPIDNNLMGQIVELKDRFKIR